MKIKKVLLSAATTLCLTAGMWAQTVIPAYVPTNSLVGWWPFNGNANDLSVNANNGTVNGATLTADRFGSANKAYGFDGISANIQTSANFNIGNNPKSISAWVKFADLSDRGWMISNNTCINGSNYNGFGFYQEGLTQNTYFYGMTNGDRQISFNFGTSSYNHFVAAFSQDTIKLFINGIQLTSSYNPLNTNSSNGILFGDRFSGTLSGSCGNDNTTGGLFKGNLDDIGIWNRALTACEVKKLYYSPSFTVSASTSSICVGQSLTLNAGGVPNYSWSNGANTSSTVVSPTVSTVYTVTSTYTTGCSDTKTISVTVNACTSISELNKENSLSIYPNPAKESITITSTNALAGKFYVIHDAIGKQVAKGILSPEKTNVSLTGLSAGLYILSVEGNLNQTYKFVKE